MEKEHKEILDDLTEDIENLKEKPWLMTALSSHFMGLAKVSKEEAQSIVSEYFKNLNGI